MGSHPEPVGEGALALRVVRVVPRSDVAREPRLDGLDRRDVQLAPPPDADKAAACERRPELLQTAGRVGGVELRLGDEGENRALIDPLLAHRLL